MDYKTYTVNNMHIYTIKTNKFKNAYIEVRFKDDIANVDMPVRTFMLQLLNTTTKQYPTIREYNISLEEIYDAEVYTSGIRNGYIFTSAIGIDFLNPKYIKEENYFKDVFNKLIDCITNPNIINKKWDELVYKNHIDNFSVYLDKYLEEPVDYTILESRRRLFEDSPVGKRVVGTKEDIKRINPTSIYQEWDKMINNSTVDIIIVGELDMDCIVELIKDSKLKSNKPLDNSRIIITEDIKPFKTETEQKDFNQTSMILYLQTKGITDKEKYFTGPLFRGILGGGGLSDKLGNYLRMKNSLCYAYSCQIVVPDSYMFIGTSLSINNVKKAKECILKAIDDMKEGNITEEEFKMHKAKLLNDIKLRQDDIFSLGNNYYNHELFSTPLYKEYDKVVNEITIDEIKDYANKWVLTYLFILKERG